MDFQTPVFPRICDFQDFRDFQFPIFPKDFRFLAFPGISGSVDCLHLSQGTRQDSGIPDSRILGFQDFGIFRLCCSRGITPDGEFPAWSRSQGSQRSREEPEHRGKKRGCAKNNPREPNGTEPNPREPNTTKPNRTQQNQTEPNSTQRNQTQPTEPNRIQQN